MQPKTPLRDTFWQTPPRLPDGLALERHEPIAVTRSGRGGVDIYDAVDLLTPTGTVPLLLAFQPRLLASHVDRLEARLSALAAERKQRQHAEGRKVVADIVPAVATDVAKPSVIDACRRAGLAVLDQRGTLILTAGSVFVYVEGKGIVERPWRGRLFSGKASRVVRLLLTQVAFEELVQPRTAQAFASSCDVSYVYAHGVLTKLERDGFLTRKSSHAGFRLKDPLGLLRTWVASGERTAVAVEGFYAPQTSRAALLGAAKRIKDTTGDAPLFSLASALEPDEVHVSGLPHGAYWTGEVDTLAQALGLKRTTPHNFLLLRPDPLLWNATGGLLLADPGRPEPVGADAFRRVALPQLAADFASVAGRGKEQADHLVGLYARRLPYRADEDT